MLLFGLKLLYCHDAETGLGAATPSQSWLRKSTRTRGQIRARTQSKRFSAFASIHAGKRNPGKNGSGSENFHRKPRLTCGLISRSGPPLARMPEVLHGAAK